MLKYHGPKEQLDAAKSLSTPPGELQALAKSSYSFVRIAVAENPNTQSHLLVGLLPDDLQSDANQYMAVALARNPKTQDAALSRLARMLLPLLKDWNNRGDSYKHFELGLALCSNKHTPIDAISPMLQPQNAGIVFRKVVARETRREDVLQILAHDRSEAVRKQAEQTLAQFYETAPQSMSENG
jgi:hypothetical protein